ncbi:glycosyl hydrolase-related protein [Flavihumibacter sp. UBA7668]|uniref:glycoside hydrolase family 38 N-terminal domain-containing protein n=1 Tax=Flavihumibacter sp. UBA7668 TaxID=1946542 RepID=UPI0025C0565C|nr:glycosyl hydrolase-related protein [Flavihumibacter sp. UBA7668]
MNKRTVSRILSVVLCMLITEATIAQQRYIEYLRPFKYVKEGEEILANAIIRQAGSTAGISVSYNNEKLPFTISDSGLLVRLPLIGNAGNIKIEQKGKAIAEERFTPMIPSDWDYFGKGTIHIISSSHQDIAWMNTPDSCREERIHKIILPAMDIMEKQPEFKFGMEQTLNLLELVNEDAAYAKRAISNYQSGQFGWGATFNQPYEGIESSEQLVRQLYLGKKWMKKEFGGKIAAETAFNIDVPARTPQFPQILARAGVKNLFISRFKEGFFNWYSPDGSKIFTYSPGNYGWAVLFFKYFDEDAPTAMDKLHKVLQNWNEYYRSRNIPPHYAVVLSNDAAGPVFYEEVLRDWNKIVALSGKAIPVLKYSTADEFLSTVNVPSARFDSISGERPDLWLYIHGPAHYEAIQAKRQSAVHLPAAETFATIDGLLSNDLSRYPQKVFDSAWYYSIYPDHGWGGKNGDITDSIFRAYLERGNHLAVNELKKSLSSIAAEINTKSNKSVAVFNDVSWKRNGLAYFPVSSAQQESVIKTAEGKTVATQFIKKEGKQYLAIDAKEIPSIGYSTMSMEATKRAAKEFVPVLSNKKENSFYIVELGSGGIKRLYDKGLKQELINDTKFSGGDILDLGYDGLDAGEFTILTPPNMRDYDKFSNHVVNWKLVQDGELLSVFEATYKMNEVDYIQRIYVYNTIKKIDIEIDLLNWKGVKNRQLTFAMPLLAPKATIDYDIPMGMARVEHSELQMRPQGWAWGGTYWQKPEEIHPRESQNFVTASTAKFGLTMSSQLAVFDWIDPTREAVSYPVLQYVLLTSQKSCHGEGPWYYQKGRHLFRFSITSHEPGWENGYQFGFESNHPLYAVGVNQQKKGRLPQVHSFFGTTDPFAKITAVKKSDDTDDVILRIVNMKEKPLNIQFQHAWKAEAVSTTNLIEEELEKLPAQGSGFPLSIPKQAIQTYSLRYPLKQQK